MTTLAAPRTAPKTDAPIGAITRNPDEKVDWVQSIPFILAHVLIIPGIWYTGVSWKLVALALGTFYLRMFGITAGYHRYFSHRSFKTGRVMQFLFALLGTLAAQKGVLWWAANHRHHHRHSDDDHDVHSPTKKGFWWSHMGWIVCEKYTETDYALIKDFAKFPELVWLNHNWYYPLLAAWALLWPICGFEGFVWGGLISTVMLWHGTFTINSLSHVYGTRRYETTDTSRNNPFLALLTMGEGWHNNHHYYPAAANQGFFWWELDVSWCALWAMSKVGLVWDLKAPPKAILNGNRVGSASVAVSGAESMATSGTDREIAVAAGATSAGAEIAPAVGAFPTRSVREVRSVH
jgi:stearoyl-CoA desaturase (delta-9 desaturase)